MNSRILILIIALVTSQILVAQDLLSKEQAIAIALESNFDIIQANQTVQIEANNTSIFNTGYLPTLDANANINYNIDNLTAEFPDTTQELSEARSDRRNAGLTLNWVVFDGFNRKYAIRSNQVNYTISQLNAKATLEVVLLDLFGAYYEIARTQRTVRSLQETLKVSKDRLVRTNYGFEYGQNTKLDVSNAQVDVNSDSINLLNAKQSLANANRNLNFLLARDANYAFSVDTSLSFLGLEEKNLMLEKLYEQNTQIMLANAGIEASSYATRISSSRYLPTLALTSGYNYAKNNNNRAAFLNASISSGISYGATLSWSIFDGGSTKVAVQNARVNELIQENTMNQARQRSILNFENAWSDFQNRLYIIDAQKKNLQANQQNFERTSERYQLGQVTSLDFRTAQNNLLQAEVSLIEARYNAKIAELTIYQLVGSIQEANF